MTDVSSISAAVGELGAKFAGRLLQPTDTGYDEARKVHNGLIDKRPALIAQCRGLADIADAIQLARRLKLEVAVRGGGHNVAGRATVDGGLMIDLGSMKAFTSTRMPVPRALRVASPGPSSTARRSCTAWR